MIFVTVGMHYQGFERLIKKMDEIAGKIDEEVVMQIGFTRYKPKNARYFDFVDDDEKILEYFRRARVIVSHAGAGTLLNALHFGKPVIVVPRLKKFGEHVDDQQLELAELISKIGKGVAVYDIDELEGVLNKVNGLNFSAVSKERGLVNFLRNYIRGLEK